MGEELDEILRAQRIQPDAAEAFAFGAAEFFLDFGGDFLEGALPGGLVFHELDEEEVAGDLDGGGDAAGGEGGQGLADGGLEAGGGDPIGVVHDEGSGGSLEFGVAGEDGLAEGLGAGEGGLALRALAGGAEGEGAQAEAFGEGVAVAAAVVGLLEVEGGDEDLGGDFALAHDLDDELFLHLLAPFGEGEAFGGEGAEEFGAVVAEAIMDDGVDVVFDGAVGECAALHFEVEEDEFGFDEGIADGIIGFEDALFEFGSCILEGEAFLERFKGGEDVAEGDDASVDDGRIAVDEHARLGGCRAGEGGAQQGEGQQGGKSIHRDES